MHIISKNTALTINQNGVYTNKMESILIIFIILVFFILIIKKDNFLKWIKVAGILCLLFPIFFWVADIFNRNVKNDDSYGENFEPIHSEIDNIKNYEKAANLILKNLNRIKKEDEEIQNKTKLHNLSYPHLYFLSDSLYMIQRDSLNLRFTAHPISTQIKNGDTTIVFNSSAGDYNMISNEENKLYEIAPYSLFRHRIKYTTKPIETSERKIKIKENYYYIITEHEEW